MATECYSQLGFGFQPKLVVDFAGGTLTTDAGLLLVREFDEQLGLSADVVGRLTDMRDADGMHAAMRPYFGDWRPASTMVCINQLSSPGARVELDMIVALPKSAGK